MKLKAHNRVHSNRVALSWTCRIKSTPSHPVFLLEILFNMTPYTPSSSPTPPTLLHIHCFSFMCATCTTHLILLDLITPIIFGEKGTSWSSSFCNLCQFPVNLYFLGPNISCRTRFWKPFEPLSFRQCERPSSPPYKETGIHYGFYWHSYYCQTQKTFNNVSKK